jgi:hypothetical protein
MVFNNTSSDALCLLCPNPTMWKDRQGCRPAGTGRHSTLSTPAPPPPSPPCAMGGPRVLSLGRAPRQKTLAPEIPYLSSKNAAHNQLVVSGVSAASACIGCGRSACVRVSGRGMRRRSIRCAGISATASKVCESGSSFLPKRQGDLRQLELNVAPTAPLPGTQPGQVAAHRPDRVAV